MSTQAQALEAEVARAQLEHAIAVLIGKAPADFSIAATPLERDVPGGAVGAAVRAARTAPGHRRRGAQDGGGQCADRRRARRPSIRRSACSPAAASATATSPAGAAYGMVLFDAGFRQAQRAQAIAVYDETFANYRQTILSAFREVEDNLAALRILEERSRRAGRGREGGARSR